MGIALHSITIPCADKVIATHFYSRIFGFPTIGKHGKTIRIQVNETSFIDFKANESFNVEQYSFKVDEKLFDAILNNIKKEKLLFGSDLDELENKQLNSWHGGRGLFFRDPNGHIIELLTQSSL